MTKEIVMQKKKERKKKRYTMSLLWTETVI